MGGKRTCLWLVDLSFRSAHFAAHDGPSFLALFLATFVLDFVVVSRRTPRSAAGEFRTSAFLASIAKQRSGSWTRYRWIPLSFDSLSSHLHPLARRFLDGQLAHHATCRQRMWCCLFPPLYAFATCRSRVFVREIPWHTFRIVSCRWEAIEGVQQHVDLPRHCLHHEHKANGVDETWPMDTLLEI